MSGRKKSKDKEAIKGVQRILEMSEADFEQWMERVVRAGLTIGRRKR